MALASGDSWLDKGATILIFGPPGVGKSHIGCGIWPRADRRRLPGSVHAPASWCSACRPPRKNLQLPQALAKLDRYDLFILDDISYVRKDQAETGRAVRADRRALRTAQYPHHGQPAVLRLEQRVPRPGHDGGGHRPPDPPLEGFRAARGRELPRPRFTGRCLTLSQV